MTYEMASETHVDETIRRFIADLERGVIINYDGPAEYHSTHLGAKASAEVAKLLSAALASRDVTEEPVAVKEGKQMPVEGIVTREEVLEGLIQPIDTAPKDGTIFWGIVRGEARYMFWHPGFGEFISSYRQMTWVGRDPEDHSPVIHRPRSWLPKPTLPDEEDA